MRQVQGGGEFPDEAQSRDYVKSYVQQEVFYALNKDNRRRPFQYMQGWKESYCRDT